MNREQLESIVEELEHQDKVQTICRIVIALGFWIVAAIGEEPVEGGAE